jgi:hypothetical protein
MAILAAQRGEGTRAKAHGEAAPSAHSVGASFLSDLGVQPDATLNGPVAAHAHIERRIGARYTPGQIPAITEVALQGVSASVIDISSTGTLVEHAGWLSMRTTVRVRVVVDGKSATFHGRVVRAKVKRLAKSGVVYEIAIAFEAPSTMLLDALGEGNSSESTRAELNDESVGHALCA